MTSAQKRIYVAAALIIAAGGGIGFLLRPANADASNEDGAPEQRAHRTEHHFSGGVLKSILPPPLNAAAANRPDCFYMRVAYANSLNAGSKAGDPAEICQAGADAGCWIPD